MLQTSSLFTFTSMKPIILLHGAIGAKDQLEPLAKELSVLGYQTYSFSNLVQKVL